MPNQNTQKIDHVNPETQVRENEDASLEDKTYSFDEDNTDSEDVLDADENDQATELTDFFDADDDEA